MVEKSEPGVVTLREVAEVAGVHPSTVSRALNPATSHRVSKAVVRRISETAERLGYRANLVAASLRTGRSHLIGILVPDIANTVFSPILSGASERLAAEGYLTVVADVPDGGRQLDLARSLVARQVEGLLLAAVTRDDPLVDYCIAQRLPAVLVNRSEARRRLSSVVSDDALGMQLAVDHLMDLGHRAIAQIGGPESTSTGYNRHRGFLAAIAARGLAPETAPCESAEAYAREAGQAAAHRLLEAHPEITAFVAANDLLALGCYDALKARGLRCPADVSVVGHNDMPLVDLVAPPLTTVRISHREMGWEAADLLLQGMRDPSASTRTLVLAPQLVVRDSTARPRTAARRRGAG